MTDFDARVIGGGTGNAVAAAAADAGLDTALVEPGPLGGTCLNRGCNPSRLLIQAANAADDVRDAGRFHVDATLDGVDHAAVVDAPPRGRPRDADGRARRRGARSDPRAPDAAQGRGGGVPGRLCGVVDR